MPKTYYVYDGENVIAELDEVGNPQATYNYNPQGYGEQPAVSRLIKDQEALQWILARLAFLITILQWSPMSGELLKTIDHNQKRTKAEAINL